VGLHSLFYGLGNNIINAKLLFIFSNKLFISIITHYPSLLNYI